MPKRVFRHAERQGFFPAADFNVHLSSCISNKQFMIVCCFSSGKEKNLSFIASPPLTDSVNPIVSLLTDFEKPLSEINMKICRNSGLLSR